MAWFDEPIKAARPTSNAWFDSAPTKSGAWFDEPMSTPNAPKADVPREAWMNDPAEIVASLLRLPGAHQATDLQRSGAETLFGLYSFALPTIGVSNQAVRGSAAVMGGIGEAARESFANEDLSAQNILLGAAGGAAITAGFQGVGAALLSKTANKFYRAAGNMAQQLTDLPRKMGGIIEDLPKLAAERRATEIATRSDAARMAFRTIVPEGSPRETIPDIQWNRAVQAARRAAARHGRGPVDFAENPTLAAEVSRTLSYRLSRVPKAGHIISKVYDDSRLAWSHFVQNMADGLRGTGARWAGVGSKAAAMLERTELLTDAAQGERVTWAERNILNKLMPDEIANLDDAIRGTAPPKNDKVATAVLNWRRLAQHGFEDAHDAGIRQLVPPTHSMGQQELFPDIAHTANINLSPEEKWIPVPLQWRPNYAPKYRDPKALRELGIAGSPLRKKAMDVLMKKYNMSAEAADNLLVKLTDSGAGGWEFDHSFQFARNDFFDEIGLPFEKDPRVWMRRWSHDTAARISRARVWGPQDEAQAEIRKALVDGHGDVPLWDKYWRNFIGHPHPDDVRFGEVARAAGTVQTITGLGPRVHILQYLQLANPIGKFGLRPTLAGIQAAVQDAQLTKYAEMTGATLPSQNMSWIGDELTDIGSWWVKNITGMPKADRFVRVVSAVTSGIKAQEWADDLVRLQGRGPRAAMIMRQLEDLSLRPTEILKRAAAGEALIKPTELRSAMLSGANITQFPSHMSNMPPAWRTGPAGRWIYKFRTFAKQQSLFIQRHIIGEARRGNLAPAARYLSSYTALHQLAAPVLDFISGVDRNEDREAYEHALDQLDGYMHAGMLGGFGDAISVARNSSAARVGGFLFGPAVGNMLQWGEAVQQSTAQSDWKPLQLRAARTIPLVGGWAYRYLKDE